jgi:hypothetical protein
LSIDLHRPWECSKDHTNEPKAKCCENCQELRPELQEQAPQAQAPGETTAMLPLELQQGLEQTPQAQAPPDENIAIDNSRVARSAQQMATV